MNNEHEHDPARRQSDGPAGSGAPQPGKPRIEVLRVPPAAAAPAGYGSDARNPHAEVMGSAAPGAAQAHAPRTVSTRTNTVRRSGGGLFRSPTMLLALLALVVIAGAIWYTASQSGGGSDRAETEVAVTTETAEAPADRGFYDDAAPVSADEAPPAFDADPAPPAAQVAPPVNRAPAQPVEVAVAPEPARPAQAAQPAQPEQREPPEPAGQAAGTSAVATARAFYSALSGGDGASAAQLVVPGKRQSGPLSAGELSRYYSSFRRPLRVRSLTPVDANTVRVAYDYVLADGRECRGQAIVNVVQSGERSLVSGIRAQGPC